MKKAVNIVAVVTGVLVKVLVHQKAKIRENRTTPKEATNGRQKDRGK
ncbi:MAG: hypothetical protein GF365_04140 [Candidatus Buchananbacteria bacterium]|nr:hypothetical protein [Candidatus Buchananbacteria bacterium]